MLARVMFGLMRFAARKGLVAPLQGGLPENRRQRARQAGVSGETYAYWYLRRHGYVLVGRNYTVPGIKGEIDLVGYDGQFLAFVEVKTRTIGEQDELVGQPENAVTADKRRNVSRMARQFLLEHRLREAKCRFDVLAIESRAGQPPVVRLHKAAF